MLSNFLGEKKKTRRRRRRCLKDASSWCIFKTLCDRKENRRLKIQYK